MYFSACAMRAIDVNMIKHNLLTYLLTYRAPGVRRCRGAGGGEELLLLRAFHGRFKYLCQTEAMLRFRKF